MFILDPLHCSFSPQTKPGTERDLDGMQVKDAVFWGGGLAVLHHNRKAFEV